MTVEEMTIEEKAVAILGYGTAGMNAAIALRNAGYEGVIGVFTDDDPMPYSPILTSYYAGGQKTFEECFPWSEADIAELDLELHANQPVTGLVPSEHRIVTSEGEFSYRKCLIATGAAPGLWGFPGVEGDEGYKPFVLRTMQDAERLKEALDDPECKRVLVSGASMVALKTLEACLEKGKQVSLVGMNPHVLDFNAFPEAAERFERGLRKLGVNLHLGQKIQSVKRVEDGLEVTFSSGETEVVDEISVSHGMRSNLGFLSEGALELDRAIVVDENMRTSNPDVYAAGDVAQALELVSGRKRVVGIWKNAALQGACAGRTIALELAGKKPDEACKFKGSISTNTIAVKNMLFISAGAMEITEGRKVEVRESEAMTVVYLFEQQGTLRRLVGFNVVADEDVAGGRAYDIGAMLTLRIEEGCRL